MAPPMPTVTVPCAAVPTAETVMGFPSRSESFAKTSIMLSVVFRSSVAESLTDVGGSFTAVMAILTVAAELPTNPSSTVNVKLSDPV